MEKLKRFLFIYLFFFTLY